MHIYPYKPSDWRDVDDRVRGGSSRSFFEVRDEGRLAIFSGTLDTSTLGGAGFASQANSFECLDLSRFSGLRLHLPASEVDEKERCTAFTLNLKTSAAEKRPDGRIESRVSFEHHFEHFGDEETLEMRWKSFEPYYRGRHKKGEKLDASRITEISIMCRSNFDQQSGPFSLTLGRLEGLKRRFWLREVLLDVLFDALFVVRGLWRTACSLLRGR